jgi:uridylate kinase
MYTRILLKLSGEQLAGNNEQGFDPETAKFIASEVKKVLKLGTQVAIIVGGGNYVRGASIAGNGIKRVTGDQMGMLATMINALALTDIFESEGVPTRCLTGIFAEQVAEPFVHRLAEKHLEQGRVVIIGGGTGRPYMTTDTGAVNLALELGCQVVLKATKVDGVYDKDPHKHDDAVRLESISLADAVQDPHIKVMDKSALGMAYEHGMNIVIFEHLTPGNIEKVVKKQGIGTLIS